MSKTIKMPELQLNQYENALIFAVQKYSVNSTIKNATNLMEVAANTLQNTSTPEIKQAADFFKDGEFNKGDRYTLANKFIAEIQRLISKSMDWLSDILEYYNVPVRSI